MTRIAAADAKNRFAELCERVENGEEIEITRYGRPVIRLERIGGAPKRSEAEVAALVKRVRDRAKKFGWKFDLNEFKEMRDEGKLAVKLFGHDRK